MHASDRRGDLLEFARGSFIAWLNGGADGVSQARNQLAARGIDQSILEQFGIGYAPDGDLLRLAADTVGFSTAEMLSCGLAVNSRFGDPVHDRFRRRITFPLCAPTGELRGFAARSTDGARSKYLDSTPSGSAHAQRSLFGAQVATADPSGRIVVVEGVMDVLGLRGIGVHHAVAALGTAITEQMLAGLDGIAEDVVFVFDLTRMGERALLRAARAADRRNLRAHLVLLPAGTSVPQLIVDKGAQHVHAGLKHSTRIPREHFL